MFLKGKSNIYIFFRSGVEARPYTVKINLYKTVENEIMADGHVFYALYVYIYLY